MPTVPSRPSPPHYLLPDFLKILAASLIIFHHLAFYGPMADHLQPLLPGLHAFLADHARLAVQVFLVLGGFFAARSLAPDGVLREANPLPAIFQRYLKLAPPFFVATLLAVAAAEVARRWMTHDMISPLPDWHQLAAHAYLLHGVLDVESIWAGAWYVAVDFQLFAMLALLLAGARRAVAGQRSASLAALLVAAAMAASLFWFNLDAGWDAWAPYFFGSYGMGVLAWWAVAPQRAPVTRAVLAGIVLLLGGLALEWVFRSRIATALGVALLLVMAYASGLRWPAGWKRGAALINWLGQRSYAIFLVHFPVNMLVSAWFTRYMEPIAFDQVAGMAVAWAGAIGAGALFHRWVEGPLARFIRTPRDIRDIRSAAQGNRA